MNWPVAADDLLLPRLERNQPLMFAAEPVLRQGVPPELVGTLDDHGPGKQRISIAGQERRQCPTVAAGTSLIAASSRSESQHPRSSPTALLSSSLRRTPTIVDIAPDAAKRGTQESNLALRFWRPPC